MSKRDTPNSKRSGRAIHPGSGRRKAPVYAKGRQIKPGEMDAVVSIVGEGPYERALLIEYLHLIQDKLGCLPAAHMQSLGELLKIPMAEVYEVATFYAHFDIVLDSETPPPKVTIRVCDSLSCMMAGAEDLIADLEGTDMKDVRVVRVPCIGACDVAPAAEVGHRHVPNATTKTLKELAKKRSVKPEIPSYQDFEAYRKEDGYTVLGACLSGERSVDEVITTLSDGGLRGLGGAGFPTGRKWGFVRAEDGPRLMAVNGDEGEPGTFKDRLYLETKPHQFLEGMLIAAWAVEAEEVFIYIRDEYPAARKILLKEMKKIEKAGLAKHTKMTMRRGAGAYICGEESAMIESIEGKRGIPRHRPPYVAQVGIFGCPTLVNNIETLYWIPEIIAKGAQWFADLGDGESKGLRSYSVSGHVQKPGVILAPAGTTAEGLIKLAGGMKEGHKFKGYLPVGASGGILPASKADLALDFGTLEKHGCFVGSHAVVILSDQDDMKAVALNLMKFFEFESCGQCTPCRNGTEKAAKLMSDEVWDETLLDDLAIVMQDASICGLGQAASNPLTSVIKFFPDDLKS